MKLRGDLRLLRDELGWARDNFVHLKTLKEIKNLVMELISRLRTVRVNLERHIYNNFILKFEEEDPSRDWVKKDLLLKVLLFGAFYPNYLESQVEDPRGVQKSEEDREKGFLAYDPRRTVAIALYVPLIALSLGLSISIYLSALPPPPKYFLRNYIYRLPADAQEDKLAQQLSQLGQVSAVQFIGSCAYVEFADGTQRDTQHQQQLYGGPPRVLPAIKLALRLRHQKWYYEQMDLEQTTAPPPRAPRKEANEEKARERASEMSWDDIGNSNSNSYEERPLKGPDYPYCISWKGMAADQFVGIERDSVNCITVSLIPLLSKF